MQSNTTEDILENNKCTYAEFMNIIKDLIESPTVRQMKEYNQHANTSCYNHCKQVAYYTYFMSKHLHLDYVSATRGAMLHDLFLYDWHNHEKPDKKWTSQHAFLHPKIALKNAKEIFDLNEIEQDVIVKHMWPVTISLPKYRESFIVTLADKYSATRETFINTRKTLHSKKIYKYAYLFLALVVIRIV